MTTLTTAARDKSTYVVTAAFTDSAGADVIPDSITWTLTDSYGTVINSREDVSIASPAASIDIVLSGDDLSFDDGKKRVLTINATYSSDEGSGLPLREEAVFGIDGLINV